jgi:predicted RNA-binding protein YlxR (DUF448 family)
MGLSYQKYGRGNWVRKEVYRVRTLPLQQKAGCQCCIFTKINLHLDPAQAPDARLGQFNHMGLSYQKYGRGNWVRKE